MLTIWNTKLKLSSKHNGSLPVHKIKNETEQLLSRYKHGRNIHECRKYQNEWTAAIRSKLATEIRFKNFKEICCSSKLIFSLHLEKYKHYNTNNSNNIIQNYIEYIIKTIKRQSS